MHSKTNNLAHKLLTMGKELRAQLEPHFAEDTAIPGALRPKKPAFGHSAAVSVIALNHWEEALRQAGCRIVFVSSIVEGASHWFVRVTSPDGGAFDVDLTGDQFAGRAAVQVAMADTLYGPARVRRSDEVNTETQSRASMLARRAGLVMPLAA